MTVAAREILTDPPMARTVLERPARLSMTDDAITQPAGNSAPPRNAASYYPYCVGPTR